MDIKITKQEHKKLLLRDECTALVSEKITPSNALLKEEIAKKLGKSADLIIIKRINQRYGKGESEVEFYFYHSEEAKKRFEKEKIKKAAQPQPAAAGG